MLTIREAIVVEGKYDKIRLQSVVKTLILETDGFRIFKDKEQLSLLQKLAAERGLVVLTDSDGAGFVIRDYLSGAIPPEQLKHAYIPEVEGKERRKSVPSREGLLGVEGLDGRVIADALRRAGVTILEGAEEISPTDRVSLTKADLFERGLAGRPDSAEKRRRFLRKAGLPEKLSTNRLLEVVNATMTAAEFEEFLGEE